jgi:integrase
MSDTNKAIAKKETRRERGEGAIYQRKEDGLWVVKYKSPLMAKQKVIYAKSEVEAKRKLKTLKYESIKNTPVEIQKISVEQYMSNWLTKVKKHELKPKSYDSQERILVNQVYPNIGEYQLANIGPAEIQGMIDNLIRKKLSFSTIKKAYDSVNACFKLGIIKGEIAKNPCVGISLPKNLKKRTNDITTFTDDEVKKICEVAAEKYEVGKQTYRLGQAIVVLLYTGLRIGELAGLKWSDIDFDNKTLAVERSAIMIKNRDPEIEKKNILVVQDSVKNRSSERIIPLNKKVIDALRGIQEINGEYEYVLCKSNGKIIEHRNIDGTFKKILKRCGINPCGLHTCRHTFASMLFKKGVDVKVVSELLGHSDIGTTYNTYIHLIKEQKQQAVGLLDEL